MTLLTLDHVNPVLQVVLGVCVMYLSQCLTVFNAFVHQPQPHLN